MYRNFLANMPPLRFTASSLTQPVSLYEDGDIATIRDLIANCAPADAISEFKRIADISTDTNHYIYPVCELDEPKLRRLTSETLRITPSHVKICNATGNYTPEAIIAEVMKSSPLGLQFMEATRMNGMIIETAVKAGNIVPVTAQAPFRVRDIVWG